MLSVFPHPGDCDFDSSFCNWTNAADDEFDWLRQDGRTPSSSTGPFGDVTGNGKNVARDTRTALKLLHTVCSLGFVQGKMGTYTYFKKGCQIDRTYDIGQIKTKMHCGPQISFRQYIFRSY
jgi:hypothetical protein